MIPVTQIWPDELAARYRAAGHWRGETFGAFLHERARQMPDKVVVVDGDTRWTYAELDARADALAARGLLLIGLDIIGDCLTEINVTSPTCFQEIAQQSGFDVARLFVEKLEAALR